MTISFAKIKIGNSYSRPELAKTWGYSGYQALARGVVTPRDDNKIVLFVTYDKPEYIEQYKDEFKGGILRWEGPTDHFAEDRMVNLKRTSDEIHVFFRERHHTDFVYEGKFTVESYILNADRPSQFTFKRS